MERTKRKLGSGYSDEDKNVRNEVRSHDGERDGQLNSNGSRSVIVNNKDTTNNEMLEQISDEAVYEKDDVAFEIISGTDLDFDELFICDNGVSDDEIEGEGNYLAKDVSNTADDANYYDDANYEIIDETGGFNIDEVLTYDYDQIDVSASDGMNDIKADDANIFEDLLSKCTRGCDNVNMTVQTSDMPKKDKKPFCKYCHKKVSKLARHLENVHKDQPDVVKFCHLPKGSRKRKSIINKIGKSGTSKFNANAAFNKGQLMPSRRPNSKYGKKATDYTTCAKCRGCFTKKCIGSHMKRCTKKTMKGERQLLVLGRTIEGRLHPNASDRLRMRVFPVMREDAVVNLIRYDWLVIVYGNKLCLRLLPSFQENLIRSQLRYAGKLLLTMKQINENITDFSSIYVPSNYDSMIDALRLVGKYDAKTNDYKTPKNSTATSTIVKDIGKLLVTEYIKKGDREKQTMTENFLKIVESDINTSILKPANASQEKIRRQNKEILPKDDDVKKFSQYLDRERKRYFVQISENYLDDDWLQLAELTMASIIVNNRRRTGETENMLVAEFIVREYLNKENRSPEEEDEDHSCVQIRGKKGRPVEAYLTFHMDKCVEMILKHRQEAGISTENPYIFALPSVINNMKTIKPCPVVEKFAELCGSNNPKSLRGTLMRKHFASMCQSMKLDDSKVGEVAIFMGHSETIHRNYYRRNPLDRHDITKMLAKSRGKHDNDSKNESENFAGNYSKDESDKFELDRCVRGTAVVHDTINGDCDELSVNDNEIHLEHQGPPTVPEFNFIVNNGKRKFSNALEKFDVPNKLKKTEKDERRGEFDDDFGPKHKFTKKRWNEYEIAAVYKAFAEYFVSKTLPTQKEILRQQKCYSELKGRSWQQIKTWISNQHKKKN